MDYRRLAEDKDIKQVIQNMTDKGESMERIRRVTGMPYESVDSIRKQHQNERSAMKRKKKKRTGY